ncbi:uncharacterized protein [Anabrus simplex]|uniref:uncharacterized protein n=1 Tax=Anabrus simplex TaxID=316456 RepID=UPI0035A399CC
MPVMYSFCFWFSVRLGSIIVGAITLVQAIILFIFCGQGLENQEDVSARIQSWLDNNDMLFLKGVMEDMKNGPKLFLSILTTYTAFHMVSCLLLSLGAYKCKLIFMYPFMALEMIRLLFLSVFFVFTMMLIKQNIYNLGLLIGCSVAGGFLILFLFYLWFCTLSMCQIVKELEQVENLGPYQPHVVSTAAPSYATKSPMDMGVSVGMGFYNGGYGTMSRPIY